MEAKSTVKLVRGERKRKIIETFCNIYNLPYKVRIAESGFFTNTYMIEIITPNSEVMDYFHNFCFLYGIKNVSLL